MPSAHLLVRELATRPAPARTFELLRELAAAATRPRELSLLHEALLFSKAYPRSKAIREFCDRELKRFRRRIRALSVRDREELAQSGIVGTRISYPYDLSSARWLRDRFGSRLDVDWSAYEERDTDPLSEVMPLLTTVSEGDASDDEEVAVREHISAAMTKRHSTPLAWIMEAFDRAFAPSVQGHLYDGMQMDIAFDLVPPGPSRTLVDDGPPPRLFLWNPGDTPLRPSDLVSEIRKPIRIPSPVDAARGRELLDLVYGVLLPRLRELYPATHGNPEEVYDIPLARGVRIILWFMQPAYRLPLEAGWGLLVLKNHVPIGYGAGGMLADRSEIAINVFDTFRGGEAAWLYSQYARIFYTLCGAPWLVTRRYQIGYENEEGIASGAYWFYDKLGFRSVDGDVRALADAERRKIASQKGYRCSRAVLKKLCQADVVLSLEGESASRYREFPLGQVGLAAGRVIADQFGGRRDGLEARVLDTLAKRHALSYIGWREPEKMRFAHMGLLTLAIPGFDRWPPRQRRAVFELCRLKGSAREGDYTRAMRENLRFFEALRRVAEHEVRDSRSD